LTEKLVKSAAVKEAEAIVATAKQDADRMRREAEQNLQATLARYETQAMDRIRQAEADIIAELRKKATEKALAMSEEWIATKLSQADHSRLVDQAIADLSKTTGTKAA
jgi:F-type H+-transporting ATPase subunit b